MYAIRYARSLLGLCGLIAFAVWLPIAVASYVPGWHAASCDWHARCARYDAGRDANNGAQQRIAELRTFMQHRGELAANSWTSKERAHLTEVRTMLDRLLVVALLGALVFAHMSVQERARSAGRAMIGIAACLVVLPFFGVFWRDVFHPLLFSNRLWVNHANDTSWWIMPRLYFQYTTALVVVSAVVICGLARYQALRQLR